MRWKKINKAQHFHVLLCSMLLLNQAMKINTQEAVQSTKKPTLPRITKSALATTRSIGSTTPAVPAVSTTSTTTTASTSTTTTISTTSDDVSQQQTAASPTSQQTDTSVAAVPDICIHGLRAVLTNSAEQTIVRPEHEFVQIIEGDAMLSVLTTDPASILFVVNRVNQADLVQAGFQIGVRAIVIENEGLAEQLLLQEVEYLQQCVNHAIGIFIDDDFYKHMEHVIKDLEYNIWMIPSWRARIFPKVAHFLYQMPWGEKIASVEIFTEHLDVYNEFMEAVRNEHMCLMHFKSAENIYILFGNKIAKHIKENGTLFAVPTDRLDREYIAELPEKSYIFMENEIDLQVVDENASHISLDEVLLGKTVLPSRVLAFAHPLLNLVHWIKGSIVRNCRRKNDIYLIEKCGNFLAFIEDWQKPEFQDFREDVEVLELLHIRHLATLMNFQMYQKRTPTAATQEPGALQSDVEHLDLKEIATQNLITNVTTFYHYNRENSTSVELKAKFGQVFNCQYSASGENSRYPFLFDGESVMFWRIKPDAWVATLMTAAILGLIVTLAILVFVVVRISLCDVFEGNPIMSVFLLLSLVLLFTSFIPFSMEYVGEHRNSHVTFDDAATLNTLCAVRVFILTLVYCLPFSLLLCRAVMLASIGSEGGFLSHVNGYIQAVICVFSVFVQLGMSVQLIIVMHVASESVSCENMYYGHWLWIIVAYDFILLLCIVALVPLIYRSQRNYREGILIVIGAVLSLIVWIVWIVLSFFGDELRDAAIPLGLQATGWSILAGILIPRTFLMVRGIERSDIAQALPSLTSLAFAQNNQYSSEQSVYECVNPAMRNCAPDEIHQSPSEIPTLPLRGGGPRRQQFFANLRQANANINPQRPPPHPRGGSPHSSQSSLPPSPDHNKITRF